MADKSMRGEERRRVARALGWIFGILNERDVPYRVVGGLAAGAYGARRPLADIDVCVTFDQAAGLLREIQPFVVWGPERHVGDTWDVTFPKEADYLGQRIGLGDSSTVPRFFSAGDGLRETQRVDHANHTGLRTFGVKIRVMPKEGLIRYKSALGREVDLVDIDRMTHASSRCDRDG